MSRNTRFLSGAARFCNDALFVASARLGRVATIVILLSFISNVTRGQSAYLIGLGHLDPNFDVSYAFGVSADGMVVTGESSRPNFQTEAFQWTMERGIVGMGYRSSDGHCVSGDGRVIVGGVSPGEAYYWIPGVEFYRMGDLPGGSFSSKAWGADWEGAVIVGSASSERSRNIEAFIWTSQDGMVGLGGLDPNHIYSLASGISSDGTIVVGKTRSPETQVAFRWTAEEGMHELSRSEKWGWHQAQGISPDGSVIVGYGYYNDLGYDAFRWTEEEGMTALGVLDETPFKYQGRAEDASVRGWIIVGWSDEDDGRKAVVWTPRRGILRLGELLANDFGVDLGTWEMYSGFAVSYDGKTIVGEGWHFENGEGITEGFLVRIPCIDDCDRCSFRERMTGTCKPRGDGTVKVIAKLSGGRVGATLTFCLDYYKAFAEATVNEDGRAKARFKRLPPGPHHLTLKECDAPADVGCE
ncbi:MAG: hypothetical protein KJ057_16875 [Phycisphaerae bacterium]|nr:hypothetical protein [Planctomycetia bacterium]MCK6466376.1 hypothetical protein [Phycisphaerae bacterium]MCL4720139.1 hypothetical protein [Phycisphaerae bacterium]NUQ10464.1 hypothetical protein [Phycisphaerae bacterium]